MKIDFQKKPSDLQATNIYISSVTRKSQNDCCRTYSYLINGENSKIEAIITGEHYAGLMNCIQSDLRLKIMCARSIRIASCNNRLTFQLQDTYLHVA
jgi:hypothetical protein